jgi:hypothetical protein
VALHSRKFTRVFEAIDSPLGLKQYPKKLKKGGKNANPFPKQSFLKHKSIAN